MLGLWLRFPCTWLQRTRNATTVAGRTACVSGAEGSLPPGKGAGALDKLHMCDQRVTERLHHQVQNCDRIDQTGESTQPQIRRLTSFWGPVLLYMSLSLLRAPFTWEVFRVARRLRFVDTSFVNFLCGTTKSCSCICLPGIMWTWWQVVGPGVCSQWIWSCSDSRSRHHTF